MQTGNLSSSFFWKSRRRDSARSPSASEPEAEWHGEPAEASDTLGLGAAERALSCSSLIFRKESKKFMQIGVRAKPRGYSNPPVSVRERARKTSVRVPQSQPVAHGGERGSTDRRERERDEEALVEHRGSLRSYMWRRRGGGQAEHCPPLKLQVCWFIAPWQGAAVRFRKSFCMRSYFGLFLKAAEGPSEEANTGCRGPCGEGLSARPARLSSSSEGKLTDRKALTLQADGSSSNSSHRLYCMVAKKTLQFTCSSMRVQVRFYVGTGEVLCGYGCSSMRVQVRFYMGTDAVLCGYRCSSMRVQVRFYVGTDAVLCGYRLQVCWFIAPRQGAAVRFRKSFCMRSYFGLFLKAAEGPSEEANTGCRGPCGEGLSARPARLSSSSEGKLTDRKALTLQADGSSSNSSHRLYCMVAKKTLQFTSYISRTGSQPGKFKT
ncbi:hypothetical protein DNTS_026624 [Danionella cerebrum]|uniref:Uncharacterized protein n=1 Tax=Danionella cerebrum TaxID=2873325 RepID=A0A553QDM4_9TELE|nr:hypothetical protein DNTS_026624 [Danionella translucida]